ncbi:MAG: hypothetical protein ACLGIN_03490 [Candidatus Sericytochromatia bacterium]
MATLPLVQIPEPLAITPIADWGFAHQDKGSPEAHIAVVAKRLSSLLAGLKGITYEVSAYKGRDGLVISYIGQGAPVDEEVEERGHILARVCIPEPCSYEQWCKGQADFARQVRLVTEIHNALVAANDHLSRHPIRDLPAC